MRVCAVSLLFFLVLPALALAAPAEEHAPGAAGREPIAALEIFRLLPATIFENTLEGLSEDEKERLLEYGKSEYWILLPDSRDSLEMVSLPFGDTRVFLHAYREDGGGTRALTGSRSAELCTLELWRMSEGHFAPFDAPPEPPVADFFARGNKKPKDVQASILFCLDGEGLEAQAVFWKRQGRAHVPVDNEVRYVWNGRHFEKRIRPRDMK
ncbi:MAG: hypothetical protein LBC79_03270 [Deltaproteobacteria bacterium]|jgi:hypothetical protein|nr:hypothetical protein [Deltaproteobacteria bacterium]